MRKIWVVMAMGMLTAVASAGPRARGVREHDHGITIADLRGNYAGKITSFLTVCTNIGGCSVASPTIVPLNSAAVTRATIDEAGNYCATATSASSPASGSAGAAFVNARVVTGSVTSLDATGQGEASFKIFAGGSCDGATFDDSGATLIATGTGHCVVLEGGDRIDSIVTTYVSVLGKVGGVVGVGSLHRQKPEGEGREHRRD